MPESYADQDRLTREEAARLQAPKPLNRDEGDATKPAPIRLQPTEELLQTFRADQVAANGNAVQPPVIEDPVKAFAAGRRWVLARGTATNREYLAAWDWKTGVTHTSNGRADSVALPSVLAKGRTGRSVIVQHNHPTATAHDIPLSPADIVIAMRVRVESMTVLGNKGSIFTARALPGARTKIVKKLDEGAFEDAMALTPAAWPEDDQLAIVQHAMNLALARYGVIDYVTSMTGVTRRFFEREADLVAKAQAVFEGVLERNRLKPLVAEAKAASEAEPTTIYEAPRGLSDAELIKRVRELRALKAKDEPGVEHALRTGEFFLKRRGLTA